jgi:hypothetical protein
VTKWNRSADDGAHRGQTSAVQKSAACRASVASNHYRVGTLRIVFVEFVNGSFDAASHGFPLGSVAGSR